MLIVMDAWFDTRIAFVIIAAFLLYLCGGFLNDWADRKWDISRRPERALPRGLFAPSTYLSTALTLAACGLTAAAFANSHAFAVAAAIAACVALYTWLHKKSAWSVVFMGLCRALLPLLGWAAAGDGVMMDAALLAGLALFLHVVGISLLARSESAPQPIHGSFLAYGCFAGSAVVMCIAAREIFKIPTTSAMVSLLPYALWTCLCLSCRLRIGAKISGLLAGIPLVDWMLLLPIGLIIAQPESLFAGFCLWLPPLAFLAGRALQRLAPAT